MAKREKKDPFKIVKITSSGSRNWYEDRLTDAVNTASQLSKNGKNILKKLNPETNRFRTIKVYDSNTRISKEYYNEKAGGILTLRSNKVRRKK